MNGGGKPEGRTGSCQVSQHAPSVSLTSLFKLRSQSWALCSEKPVKFTNEAFAVTGSRSCSRVRDDCAALLSLCRTLKVATLLDEQGFLRLGMILPQSPISPVHLADPLKSWLEHNHNLLTIKTEQLT